MKWSIALPSYDNYSEVYFTVQSLRLHHNLFDCEIVIADNVGDPVLERFCKEKGNGVIRYEKCNEIRGVSHAKNRAIAVSKGDYVLCMDSHILLKQGVFETLPPADDLVQGPCLSNSMKMYGLQWKPRWRASMWGTWDWIMSPEVHANLDEFDKKEVKKLESKGDFRVAELPMEPFEIWATGAGFFCCRREAWLGFNSEFRGFGGETGYIQEKYRQAGRKVWCDPTKIWVHYFAKQGRKIPFPIPMWERTRNYIVGYRELGLDENQIKEHFGEHLYKEAIAKL